MTSRQRWITAAVGLLAVAVVAALVVWALVVRSGREQQVTVTPQPFSRYRAAWSSAMRKAGVKAVFPDGPVDVTAMRARGRRSFEATFTAEEVGALMAVYPFRTSIGGQEVALSDPVVTFPAAGEGAFGGTLIFGGASYSVRMSAPLAFKGRTIDSPGLTSLDVEGFSVGGSRRRQAGEAVIEYLNAYLREAPGLTVERARIVPGGVQVAGFVAGELENPIPSSQQPTPSSPQ